jgi:hypothetical protein
MASTLKVDNLQNSAGTNLLVNGYPRQPGQIIEYLTSVCDGSAVTVGSGTYTFPNVTTQQAGAITYQTITGSNLAYTPPAGATRVVYRFQFASYWISTHAINDYKFFIDSDEVVYARHNRSAQYQESRYSFDWTIAIGGATNFNTGRLATWTTPKTLSMQFRVYALANANNLHGTVYWDGVNSNQFSMPSLTIIAIA